MPPWAQIVLVACAVILTVALVAALVALRRTALRADTVLSLVEGQLRPLTTQVTALLAEVQVLTQRANTEMERVGGIMKRADEVSATAARVAQTVGGLTRVGQAAALLAGLKRGVDVFVKRLRKP